MLTLFYSDLYTGALDDAARFPKHRYRLVRDELTRRGLFDDMATLVSDPEPISTDLLALAHDPDYITRFVSGEMTPAEIRRIGFRPWTPEFVARTLTIAGASLQATRLVCDGAPFSGNLAGGTHHAFADHGEGYCVFNDLAVCALYAMARGFSRPFILDLDVHQGNGTSGILADHPDVFTYSLHCGKNYPFRKTPGDLDVALPEGASDDDFLLALEDTLPGALYAHQPDIVFYQGGVDPLAADALGRMNMTREGLARRNRIALDYAAYWSCPVVVLMGGGYADPIELSAQAHADLYEELAHRYAAAVATLDPR